MCDPRERAVGTLPNRYSTQTALSVLPSWPPSLGITPRAMIYSCGSRAVLLRPSRCTSPSTMDSRCHFGLSSRCSPGGKKNPAYRFCSECVHELIDPPPSPPYPITCRCRVVQVWECMIRLLCRRYNQPLRYPRLSPEAYLKQIISQTHTGICYSQLQ